MEKDQIKHGLITGTSKGLGLATAELLTQDPGYHIIGTSASGAHAVNRPNYSGLTLDLSGSDSIASLIDSLGDIQLDFIINNAGILLEDWDNPEINLSQLRQTFEVNFFGTVELTEKLLPRCGQGAHIVNITSEWGSFSDPNFTAFQPHYKMSKTALNMYTKLLAERLKDRKIWVSALDPGWLQTTMGGPEAPRKPGTVAVELKNLLEHPGKTGCFWHRGKVRDW